MTLGKAEINDELRQAVKRWDEICDVDFRCPQAGKWPRTVHESADWAHRYGHVLVGFIQALLNAEMEL